MLLVGLRLGGGRLLVDWVGLFHAFGSFLVKRLYYYGSRLIYGLVLLCFERRLYVGCLRIRMIMCILLSLMYNSSAMELTCRKILNLLLTQ